MRLGSLTFALCTLSWGTIGVLVRDVDLSSPVITWFRLCFGVVVVVAWLAVTGRLGALAPRARRGVLVSSGILLSGHWVLQFEAYQRLPVAAAILIVFLGPVLTVALAPAVLRERLRPSSIVALVVALGGIALITIPQIDSLDGLGVLAALGSAVLFAFVVLAGKILTAHYEAGAIVTWQFGVALVVLAPALVGVSASAIGDALPELLVLGGLLTGALGIVFFRAMRVLEAQQVSVLFYLEPASAVLYAWWLLAEEPAAGTLAGGALIVLAGMAIITRDVAAPVGYPEPVPAKEEP